MRLSEAIRLGAMLHPQAFGVMSGWQGFWHRKKTTCALGAAFEAANCPIIRKQGSGGGITFRGQSNPKALFFYEVQTPAEWNEVTWRVVDCPLCYGERHVVWRMIPHLNDYHKWTREHIARWIETLEPSEDEHKEAIHGVKALGTAMP